MKYEDPKGSDIKLEEASFWEYLMFWRHEPRYWPSVREITGHRWIALKRTSNAELWCFFDVNPNNCWVNTRMAGDLWRHDAGVTSLFCQGYSVNVFFTSGSIWCHRSMHYDVIKWKHFPSNWPFVRGIHRSRWIPHTKTSDAELWCFVFMCVWINGWVNNREAGDLRLHCGHCDVIIMVNIRVSNGFPYAQSQIIT